MHDLRVKEGVRYGDKLIVARPLIFNGVSYPVNDSFPYKNLRTPWAKVIGLVRSNYLRIETEETDKKGVVEVIQTRQSPSVESSRPTSKRRKQNVAKN